MDTKLIRHRFSSLKSLCDKLQLLAENNASKPELQKMVMQLSKELEIVQINIDPSRHREEMASLGITPHDLYILIFRDVRRLLQKPNLGDKKTIENLIKAIRSTMSFWEERVLNYLDDISNKDERTTDFVSSKVEHSFVRRNSSVDKKEDKKEPSNQFQNAMAQSKLILLLGAGASKPLDIPTMKEFWRYIKWWAENRMMYDARDALRKIEETYATNNIDKFPDLEQLLLLLDKYRLYYDVMFNDPIFGLKPDEVFKYRIPIVADKFKTYLEKHIQYDSWYSMGIESLYGVAYQSMVELYWPELEPASVINLYTPLFDLLFSETKSPLLPIFTTNYDNVIEKYCEYTTTDLEYGFIKLGARSKWNRYSFSQYTPPKDKLAIVLFKLHGSLSWHREHGEIIDYAKPLDYKPGSSAVIYPTQTKEYPYEEPFKTAYRYFEDCLHNAKIAIVIGYSFRDPGLMSIIRDAEETNRDLTFIVICGSTALESESFKKNCPKNILTIPSYFESGEDAQYLKLLRQHLKSSIS
jgi:hypothetical protein